MPTTDPLDQAVSEIREFSRFFTRTIGALDYSEQLDTPFTLGEARVLYELARRERTQVQRLREELGLSAAYLSRMLGRFQEQRLVVRERHALDARHQDVMLTGAGRAAAARLDERARASVAGLLGTVPRARLPELTGALGTARQILSGPAAPGPVRLRDPEPGDLGWVIERNAAVYAAEFGWDGTYEALVARIVAEYANDHDPRGERCWIAESDGRRAGCVFCVRDDSPGTARLRLLLVDPAARGQGLGDRLVAECVAFARAAGYRELVLWTNDVLTAARRIYRRAGFELVAEKPHHSFGHDLVGQDWRLVL